DAASLFVHNDDGAREAQKELSRLQAKLTLATDDYNADLISRPQFLRITADLRPRIEKANTTARRTVPGVSADVIRELIADPEATWVGIRDMSQRHAILASIGIHIRILPTRKGPWFDPESIEINWPGDQSGR
ncbi:hypothetical protein, partial [Frankia sp. AvcI1]